MAKVQLNSALSSLSGRMDNWVYRRTRRGTSVAKRPSVSGIATAGQLAVRERFRLAAAYAKSALLDPALRSRYEAAARPRGPAPYPFALTDYLTLPVVESIDASGVSPPRRRRDQGSGFDDFEVTDVTVTVRDGSRAHPVTQLHLCFMAVWEKSKHDG